MQLNQTNTSNTSNNIQNNSHNGSTSQYDSNKGGYTINSTGGENSSDTTTNTTTNLGEGHPQQPEIPLIQGSCYIHFTVDQQPLQTVRSGKIVLPSIRADLRKKYPAFIPLDTIPTLQSLRTSDHNGDHDGDGGDMDDLQDLDNSDDESSIRYTDYTLKQLVKILDDEWDQLPEAAIDDNATRDFDSKHKGKNAGKRGKKIAGKLDMTDESDPDIGSMSGSEDMDEDESSYASTKQNKLRNQRSAAITSSARGNTRANTNHGTMENDVDSGTKTRASRRRLLSDDEYNSGNEEEEDEEEEEEDDDDDDDDDDGNSTRPGRRSTRSNTNTRHQQQSRQTRSTHNSRTKQVPASTSTTRRSSRLSRDYDDDDDDDGDDDLENDDDDDDEDNNRSRGRGRNSLGSENIKSNQGRPRGRPRKVIHSETDEEEEEEEEERYPTQKSGTSSGFGSRSAHSNRPGRPAQTERTDRPTQTGRPGRPGRPSGSNRFGAGYENQSRSESGIYYAPDTPSRPSDSSDDDETPRDKHRGGNKASERHDRDKEREKEREKEKERDRETGRESIGRGNGGNPALGSGPIIGDTTAYISHPSFPIASANALATAVESTLASTLSEPSSSTKQNADIDTVRPDAGIATGTTSTSTPDPSTGIQSAAAVGSSGLDFSHVGGLDSHLQALHEMVVLPLLHPEIFEAHGIVPPRGVLFTGPPGTGKTLTARALASTCSRLSGKEVSFFVRKGADCLSKWVGEAERQLRLLFNEARERQPSVIFFDEIDGLAPVRSARQDQAHASLVSTLLALMDGLDNRGQVIIIGATNRVDAIDPALRRPGRFDRELLFALPSPQGREQILKIHTKTWPNPPKGALMQELVRKTAGYCGADLRSLCVEASLRCIRKQMPHLYNMSSVLGNSSQSGSNNNNNNNSLTVAASKPLFVTRQDFLEALQDVVPASHRAVGTPASPLSFPLDILLQTTFTDILTSIDKIFPKTMQKSRKQDMTGNTSTKDGSSKSVKSDNNDIQSQNPTTHTDPLVSSSILELLEKTRKPRFLVHGSVGLGQQQLTAAILHEYESLPIFSLHLPSLLADSVSNGSIEASIVHIFTEARRNSPSIIYWPSIDQWWSSVSIATRTVISLACHELPINADVFIIGYSEEHFDMLPVEIQSIFVNDRTIETYPEMHHSHSGHGSHGNTPTTTSLMPLYQQRYLFDLEKEYKNGSLNHIGFFAPAISLLIAPYIGQESMVIDTTEGNSQKHMITSMKDDEDYVENKDTNNSNSNSDDTTDTTVTTNLKNTKPININTTSMTQNSKRLQQRTHDEVLLLHLRMFLRSVISFLLRNYPDFIRLPEADSTYLNRVLYPLFLLDILSKVNDSCYLSVREFLLDIDLLTANTQRAYSLSSSHGRTLINRACDLQDSALSLCLGLDKNIALACEVVASRLRVEAKIKGTEFTPWPSLIFTPDAKYMLSPPLLVADAVNTSLTQKEIQRIQQLTQTSQASSQSNLNPKPQLVDSTSMQHETEIETLVKTEIQSQKSESKLDADANDDQQQQTSDMSDQKDTNTLATTCFDERVTNTYLSSTSIDNAKSMPEIPFIYPTIDVRLLHVLFHGIEKKVTQVIDVDQLDQLFATLFYHAKESRHVLNKNKALMQMIFDVKTFLQSNKRQNTARESYDHLIEKKSKKYVKIEEIVDDKKIIDGDKDIGDITNKKQNEDIATNVKSIKRNRDRDSERSNYLQGKKKKLTFHS